MENTKTSVLSSGLIWFGAGVSIAEILTGTLLAPLGFQKGLLAIMIGHVIGCVLLYLAGLIGANTKQSSMETVKNSFGQKGSLLFSTLNVLQLVGWTAVMIVSGAAAAGSVVSFGSAHLWSVIIGLLIIVWLMVGIKNLNRLNALAMTALFVLTIVMSTVIFRGDGAGAVAGEMSFGAAVELSVAMPLSWLPLISDYTRSAKKPKTATAVSAVVYFTVSCWMYVIGMGAAIFTGESDIAKIMVGAGLGVVALVIIIVSTVTTTYLDVYSAGVSAVSISDKLKEKPSGVVVCLLGMALAIFTPITQFESFLYLIGSVFAPMVAILLTDYFILHQNHFEKGISKRNIAIWVIGFIIYRVFMYIDTPLGSTFPIMIIISVISILVNKVLPTKKVSK